MIDLDLSINSYPIVLGRLVDDHMIKNCNLMKIGFFSKVLFKKLRRGLKYWAKNCEISCFNEEFKIKPNLDITTGSSMMYGTSAYFYQLNDHLDGITFQCIGGDRPIAMNTKGEFRKICEKSYGPPTIEGLFFKWQDENSIAIAELSSEWNKAYFHWMNLELYSRMR